MLLLWVWQGVKLLKTPTAKQLPLQLSHCLEQHRDMASGWGPAWGCWGWPASSSLCQPS